MELFGGNKGQAINVDDRKRQYYFVLFSKYSFSRAKVNQVALAAKAVARSGADCKMMIDITVKIQSWQGNTENEPYVRTEKGDSTIDSCNDFAYAYVILADSIEDLYSEDRKLASKDSEKRERKQARKDQNKAAREKFFDDLNTKVPKISIEQVGERFREFKNDVLETISGMAGDVKDGVEAAASSARNGFGGLFKEKKGEEEKNFHRKYTNGSRIGERVEPASTAEAPEEEDSKVENPNNGQEEFYTQYKDGERIGKRA